MSAFQRRAHVLGKPAVNIAKRTHPPETDGQTDGQKPVATSVLGPLPPPRGEASTPQDTPSSINETIRLMNRTQSAWVGGDGAANSCCHQR